LEANYSRLFSGRRLGKSALLKFIELTEDGKPLPSGCTLRVLYIPIAGAETEWDIVHRITAEVRARLGIEPPPQVPGADPGDTLVALMDRFLEERPQLSLLVILDEADVFVEA